MLSKSPCLFQIIEELASASTIQQSLHEYPRFRCIKICEVSGTDNAAVIEDIAVITDSIAHRENKHFVAKHRNLVVLHVIDYDKRKGISVGNFLVKMKLLRIILRVERSENVWGIDCIAILIYGRIALVTRALSTIQDGGSARKRGQASFLSPSGPEKTPVAFSL